MKKKQLKRSQQVGVRSIAYGEYHYYLLNRKASQQPVLCCAHPTASHDLNQVIRSSYWNHLRSI